MEFGKFFQDLGKSFQGGGRLCPITEPRRRLRSSILPTPRDRVTKKSPRVSSPGAEVARRAPVHDSARRSGHQGDW
jgi:hypothetical protein